MPAPIPFVDRDKQVDDDWTVNDANAAIRASERIEEAGRLEHTEDGEHLMPAPEAVARIVHASGNYSLDWSKNVVAVKGGSTGIGLAGRVQIDLVNNMEARDAVGLIFHPEGESVLGAIVTFATQTSIIFEIYDDAGILRDASGLVEIYGLRLL